MGLASNFQELGSRLLPFLNQYTESCSQGSALKVPPPVLRRGGQRHGEGGDGSQIVWETEWRLTIRNRISVRSCRAHPSGQTDVPCPQCDAVSCSLVFPLSGIRATFGYVQVGSCLIPLSQKPPRQPAAEKHRPHLFFLGTRAPVSGSPVTRGATPCELLQVPASTRTNVTPQGTCSSFVMNLYSFRFSSFFFSFFLFFF